MVTEWECPEGRERVSRRGFIGAAAAALAGLAVGMPVAAQPRARVVLARGSDLKSIFGTPDYDRLLDLLTRAITLLTGEQTAATARRRFLDVNDHLAVQIATSPLAVTPEVVDTVVTTAGRAGVAPSRQLIYSADERDLFRAGFALRREGPGVRCYGSNSEGHRDSVTGLLNGEVTALVSVPCLSPHPEAGLAGAVQCFANSVKPSRAAECNANGGLLLPTILAERAVRSRVRLHVMDCLRPAYDLPLGELPARWDYNGLLVSTDAVALDAVAAQLLHAKRREVKGADWPLDPYPDHIAAAADQYALGVADLPAIEVLRLGPSDGALI